MNQQEAREWNKQYRLELAQWKKETLSFKEACAYLGVTYGILDRAFQQKRLQASRYMYDCPRRFTKEELDRFGSTLPAKVLEDKDAEIERLKRQIDLLQHKIASQVPAGASKLVTIGG